MLTSSIFSLWIFNVAGMFIIWSASSFEPDTKIVLIISYDFQSLPGSV